MRAFRVEGLAGVALCAAVACTVGDDVTVHRPAGTPLPGLDDAQFAAFNAGLALFNKVYLPEEGLGPLFNENQCSACHTDPAPGGTTGFEFVTRATRFADGVCDPLSDEGGENIRTQATPLLRAQGIERESIPPSATGVGRFTTPFLFGLGLVEGIPEDAILAREDPEDADGDGISGRAGRTPDGRLARFGRKAEQPTLREFVDTALRFEMGITTPLKTEEETVNGAPMPPGTDPAPDPEAGEDVLEALTTFVRFLAPVSPVPGQSPAQQDTLDAGRQLFDEIGCPACHTPSMRTGPSDVPALDRKTVALYSDLLLHDMGPGLADVCGPTATPAELRTEMLMGLQHRTIFLHDGRALDLREAVLEHGGEAQTARDAFAALSWLRQEYVVRFLQSL